MGAFLSNSTYKDPIDLVDPINIYVLLIYYTCSINTRTCIKVNEAQMCVTMNDCPNVVALRMSGKLLEQVISSERSNEGERDPFIHQEGVSSTM